MVEFFKDQINSDKEKSVFDSYQDLFARIERLNTVPIKENRDWSIKRFEKQLSVSFEKAGEEALEANDGKIYTTLSGGLDSALALAILRKNFPEAKIITFCMGGNEKHEDIQHARLAAREFKSEHVEIIPSPEDIQEAAYEYREKFPEYKIDESTSGNIDVYLLYKHISQHKPKLLIVHDGIDEQMGGYWEHRREGTAEKREEAFRSHWEQLKPRHLEPLTKTSQSFDIKLSFPYLDEDLIKVISDIPLDDRVSDSVGKKPLRELARQYNVPKEIIERRKRGQGGMLEIKH